MVKMTLRQIDKYHDPTLGGTALKLKFWNPQGEYVTMYLKELSVMPNPYVKGQSYEFPPVIEANVRG